MVEINKPIKPAIHPLIGSPAEVNDPQIVIPNIASNVYSTEVKFSDSFNKRGVNIARQSIPNSVPIKEAIVAKLNALPASPLLARTFPSKTVAAADPVPGIPINTADIDPP